MARKNQTEIIAEALAVLRDGGLILYPTDTVWGIGCDATNPAAVAKVAQEAAGQQIAGPAGI